MMKIIIFIIYFVFFNLSTTQSIAYVDKLTDKQKNLIGLYDDCDDEREDKYFFSLKFRLTNVPDKPERYQCELKYAELIYKSFDSVQEKDQYHDYHYYRFVIGDSLLRSKDKNQILKGLKHLENMFDDPVYEKNILLYDDGQNINYFKIAAATQIGWNYNIEIDLYDKKKALRYMQYCANNKNKEDSYFSVYVEYCLNNLGSMHDQKKDYKKAYELYKKSAYMGNHFANSNLAKFYLFGLGGIEKSYEKAIRYYKLARITDLGDEQFIDLLILYDKGRLPKNITEYMGWLEEFIIQGKDGHGFQQLAWLASDNQSNINSKIDSYKWHYLASKYSPDENDKERSPQEMHILEKEVLNEQQNKEAVLEAEKWIKKNWKN